MLEGVLKKHKLDTALIMREVSLRYLTGVTCDNGVLVCSLGHTVFYTDFRYLPAVRRLAPQLVARDIRKLDFQGRRIGYESGITKAQFDQLSAGMRGVQWVDVTKDLTEMRAVKSEIEVDKIRAAAKLNCAIWAEAQREFKAGMSERQMAAIIKRLMLERGDGESFETIVCVGKQAAECHHVPDDTLWNGREPVLVDMGVKLAGYCSDMTRNLVPRRSGLYRQVYDLVLKAHDAAIAAAKPGITGRQLDAVARRIITKGGFGRCFGHSLGHGVGMEIHEAPYASRKSDWVLQPGMLVTIEPGIYLEDNLGVRIEDLILITDQGCEVLSTAE